MSDTVRTRLTISPVLVRRALVAVSAVVTLFGVAGELGRTFASDDDRLLPETLRTIRRNFNPSDEQTVGAWLTASILLLCGLLLFGIASVTRARGGRFVAHWRVLGGIFLFLSADEAVAFHEQLGDWVRRRVETGGPLLWAWVIPYGVAVVVLAVAYAPFLRALPWETRRRVLLAGAIFVGGALGLEMIQAAITDRRGRGGGPVSVLAVIEEGSEMLGAILFLDALLIHLALYEPGASTDHRLAFAAASSESMRIADRQESALEVTAQTSAPARELAQPRT